MRYLKFFLKNKIFLTYKELSFVKCFITLGCSLKELTGILPAWVLMLFWAMP